MYLTIIYEVTVSTVFFFVPQHLLFAQGIKFEEGLNWEQIKQKAKNEYKYIFIDCYASWCVPCKYMDKDVYTNDTIGSEIQKKFISVKVQMDTTNADNEFIRGWYKDAQNLKNKFEINAFPTFLFFSPEGQILHKEVGYKDVARFISLIHDALDSNKQYYTLLGKYFQGDKTYSVIPYLFNLATSFNCLDLARKISTDYVENYLLLLPSSMLFTEDNVFFLATAAKTTSDQSFRILYDSLARIKEVMKENPAYIPSVVEYLITKEEIDPEMLRASRSQNSIPNWAKLTSTIQKRFNGYYSKKLVLKAQIRWYAFKRNASQFTRSTASLLKRFGDEMTNDALNENAWDICQQSNEKTELELAASWMEKVLKTEKDSANGLPASLDTYASLLYRLGDKAKAKVFEKQALDLAIRFKKQRMKKEYTNRMEKMLRDQPIYPFAQE